jgi:hypothetical protein
MSTIVTRAGKGSPLTNTELDSNFSNLNTDKYESGSNVSVGTLAASGAASFAAGAVGTPSVTFTGDLNTGIWSPAADTIAFSEGGAEAMRITSDGRLGVGLVSPAYQVDVSGDIRASNYLYGTAAVISPLHLHTGASDLGISNTSAYSVTFSTNGAERMRINSSGNVGIGTFSPAGRVHSVPATVNAGLSAAFVTSQGGSGANTGSSIRLGYETTAGAYAEIGGAYQNPGIYLTFRTNADNVSAPTERMRLDASGNLGLGVTPSAWNTGGNLVLPGSRHIAFANAVGTVVTNGFNDGSWKYVATAAAARYDQNAGAHQWFNAASGTAGNAISFTQAMTLNASGNLSLGGNFSLTASAAQKIFWDVAGQYLHYIEGGGVPGDSWVRIAAANAERLRLTSNSEAIFGNGDAEATPSAATIRGTNGSGTNIAGAALLIQGGRGTGSANGGDVSIRTAAPGSSGTTLNGVTERLRVPAVGGVVVGATALATSATDGFLYVPTCAGTPTGTPTTQTGTAPIVVDTTNNKLYFYSAGQWRDAGP